jgi:hypothetical protein
VVVFKDEASFSRFKPIDAAGRRRDRVAGYFLGSREGNYIVVPMHRNAARTFQYLFHEYTHSVVRQDPRDVPEWLNEGLAEFYSTFRAMPREGRSIVGEPPPNRTPLLGRGELLPLREVLAMDAGARLQADARRQQLFYAQAWALVHFLNLGDDGRHRPGIARYLAAVQDGGSVEAAVATAFGMPLETLERAAAAYARRETFPQLVIAEPVDGVRIRTSLEAMRQADVEALQNDLLETLARATAPHR